MTSNRLARLCLLFALSAPAALAGCGGCPWTESSNATITPATPCLQLQVSQGDRHLDNGVGGCVDPVLFGTNTCTEPVTFRGETIVGGVDVVVAPGAPFEVAAPLPEDSGADHFDFEVAARLGSTDLAIKFRTYAP